VLRVEALVLRIQPLGEADKLVTLMTREEGKVRAVAPSARRSRKRFGSALEPWSRVAAQLFERERAELLRLDSCDLLESSYRLQEHLETAYLLAYFAEVSDRFARERLAEPRYFRLLVSLVSALKTGLPLPVAARYFEIWTLKLHGLFPDPAACGACGSPLGRTGGLYEGASGSVLCRKCRARPTPADAPLSSEGIEMLGRFLRAHPSELGSGGVPGRVLPELARMTGAALAAFAEGSFRTTRFLAVAERGA
jgi:DNA repair protein RecO (recombination protein O)